jgi:hypothetical protein
MPPSGRLATMRVSSRPQRAHVARRERASQGPQIRPSGPALRPDLPEHDHHLAATGAPGPDHGMPGIVQDVGQAQQHRRAAGIARGERVRMGSQVDGQLLQNPRRAPHRDRHRGLQRRLGLVGVQRRQRRGQLGDRRSHRGFQPCRLPGEPGGRRRSGHSPSGFRIEVRRTAGTGPAESPAVLRTSALTGLDLDEVVRGAAQDVAQRRQGVHRQALRRLGNQPEHLLAGQGDAAFGQQRHQVGGLEHVCGGHELAQVPAVTHLLDHGWPSSQSPA